jgi:hypothetical protein
MQRTGSRGDSPDTKNGYGLVNAVKALSHVPRAFYPPENFRVTRLENYFVFFYQYVDRLEWEENPLNSIPVVGYRIYARPVAGPNLVFELLAELESDTFSYEIRGLDPGETYGYKITSVDEEGNESVPAFTTKQ